MLDSSYPNLPFATAKPAEIPDSEHSWYTSNLQLTCMKNFQENLPVAIPADSFCNGLSAGTRTSAQMIVDTAISCSVNPQVILVLLQKEQGLVTDDWPWPIQYRAATGFSCPDTAPCDPEFYGFTKQIYYGIRQFQRYSKNPNSYSYRAGTMNYVQYNPNSNCGGTNVFIQNQATANLYIYTPYQPNSAALNNLLGSGDSCSAYGNRNFWRLFNDWFGPTVGCPQSDNSFVQRLYRSSDRSYLITRNSAEVCYAVSFYGYTLEASTLNSLDYNAPNARSVYRLSRNGSYLYTANPGERDMAMSQYGYTYEGVAFYGSAVQEANMYPVYRLTKNGAYVLTVSQVEAQALTGAGFSNEGVVFYAPSSSVKRDVYRLTKNGLHLFTSSPIERDLAISSNGYTYQGVAFTIQSGQTGDTLPMYRFVRNGRYLLTSDPTEKLIALNSGYKQETSYSFTYSANYPSTQPIYRLSKASNGDYLYTTNADERDQAVNIYGYKFEGTSFNFAP